ncbi:MAG: TonB-dependent receptor, partial [Eubacterium sp.]|nr:TonB-dependent receptor [Eubacterium sp.]
MVRIKERIKGIIAVLLSLLIILSVTPITVFAASENLGRVSGGSDIDIDVSWHYGHQLHTTTKSGTTYPIFCIEYGTTSPEKSYLKAKRAGSSAKVITAAKWIFAGYYMEHGNSINWKDMAMCQKKVWSIMGDSTSWDFSSSDYNDWIENAEKNMEKLDTKPSFHNTNVGTITAGTSKTITDSNKVFKDYPAFTINKNGIKMVHEAGTNKLVITIDKTCTKNSFKINNGDYYKENTGDDDELLLFYPYGSEDYQKLIYSAYYDPISFALDGDIEVLGSAKLKKTSEDGKVSGIKFTVTGDGYSKTMTTDSNGEWELDYLVPGKYTITEESIDRYEPQSSKTITVKSGETASVSFGNVLKKGDLQITKTCEDGLVEGIRFHLTGTSLSGAAINEYATTNSSGVATFKNILIGTGYVVEEVDTAIRYVIPDSQTTSIKWNEVTKASFTNKLKKFRVSVTKQDKEKVHAQGDASLAGATYGIYDNGKLIDTYTTDENGEFTTSYYVCGDHWTIKEISPSEGYLLDKTVYDVGAQARLYTVEYNTTSNTVKEQVIKGNISIIKHSDDGSTQIETPEPEAEFQVYLKSAGSYSRANADERDVLDCNEDGYAKTKDLPYGVYTVHQTKGVDGSEFIQDFDVYIAENGKTYKYLINNAPFKAYLKITKVDRETGKTVPYAGAGFEIYDSSGNKVSQTFTYPKKTTISTYYTNAD